MISSGSGYDITIDFGISVFKSELSERTLFQANDYSVYLINKYITFGVLSVLLRRLSSLDDS
jgi:hypothetical protein